MRHLNLDQLRTLVTIGELGSFAAAAQALHLAPPTVSLHVSELEDWLGVMLLERSSRGAAPTTAGAELIERGRRLLKDADEAADHVRRHAEGRAGKVRIGTSTGVLAHLLPPVLEALRQRHPGVELEIEILGSSQAIERLTARSLDIGIVSLPQAAGRLELRPWRSDPMVAFLPASWHAPRRITAQWLAGQPLIGNDPTTHMHRLTAEWFGRAGLAPRPRIELNYSEAIKSLVAAGYGAAVLPLEQHDPDAALPAGVQVRRLQPALTLRLGVAHRPAATLGPATRHVLALLV